jgi:hypothetical protein
VKVTIYRKEWDAILRKAADAALVDMASAVVREAQIRLRSNGSIFTGNLMRSLAFNKPFADGKFRAIGIGFMGGSADVFRYAMAVERGRKPGKAPPPGALDLWVERKLKPKAQALKSDLTQGGNRTGRAFRQIKRGRRLNTVIRSIAFLIGRKIAKEGTKPHPFLLPAWDMHLPKLGLLYAKRVAEAAKEQA